MRGATADSQGQAHTAAYFGSTIKSFLSMTPEAVLGCLASASQFDVELAQRDAWTEQVAVLREAFAGLDGHVFLEFDIPRLGSRIDAVAVVGAGIFAIEFKVGAVSYSREDINQAWDYALDLKNFHRASHDAPIFPVLVATEASHADASWGSPAPDGVRPPMRCNSTNLHSAIHTGLLLAKGESLEGDAWGRAPYHPTPTIIQAAQALYANHSVDAISRNDAKARNLSITSRRVEDVIDKARDNAEKAIVFVTGVPGAGKTLVGLNIATRRRDERSATHAVFLSGNKPLVDVLREALIRDEVSRNVRQGKRVRKGQIAQKVKPFIQLVHHFRDDGIRDESAPPHDHVVIFDEAQRAWDRAKTSDFMKRRKGRPGFEQSEPDFLLSYMDRHPDWAVVVCLVGGGQEIHTGEAGIAEWLDAIREHFPHWKVFASPILADSEYAALAALGALERTGMVQRDAGLHLAVSLRSFRAERVSGFVKAALDRELDDAREHLTALAARYPIVLTRDLNAAKRWVRSHSRGSERFGLVASSQAQRLKPHAIDVRVNVNPVHWFLNDSSDTRSSYYLEDAATEFQVQGLELDWVCMTWDADLRHTGRGWAFHSFRGDKWTQIRKDDRQRYLLNAYRVLLTRARQGMVVFVPHGDLDDPTRLPAFYDGTYDYLTRLGIVTLSG